MKISEIEVGFKFNHGVKGKCIVIDRTKRTITIIHSFGKTKVTFKRDDVAFSPSDF